MVNSLRRLLYTQISFKHKSSLSSIKYIVILEILKKSRRNKNLFSNESEMKREKLFVIKKNFCYE